MSSKGLKEFLKGFSTFGIRLTGRIGTTRTKSPESGFAEKVSDKGPVLVHLIQNYEVFVNETHRGKEYVELWTTGVLPNGDPACYHERFVPASLAVILDKRSKDGH